MMDEKKGNDNQRMLHNAVSDMIELPHETESQRFNTSKACNWQM